MKVAGQRKLSTHLQLPLELPTTLQCKGLSGFRLIVQTRQVLMLHVFGRSKVDCTNIVWSDCNVMAILGLKMHFDWLLCIKALCFM